LEKARIQRSDPFMDRKWIGVLTLMAVALVPAGLALAHGAGDAGGDSPGAAIAGSVTAVSSGSFSVAEATGTTIVVDYVSGTTFRAAGVAVPSSDLAVGERVSARGSMSGGALQASAVQIAPVSVEGIVTAVSGQTLTVQTQSGATVGVTVTSSTRMAPPSARVAQGDRVHVQGIGSATAVTALGLEVAPAGRPAPAATAVTGTITAVGPGSFTVAETGASGTSVVVTYTAATKIKGGSPAQGDRVAVEGTMSGGALQAIAIRILPPPPPEEQTGEQQAHVQGTLAQAVTLTVTAANGSTVTVTVPAGAKVDASGDGNASMVTAEGLQVRAPDEDSDHGPAHA
jgi:hypothetical protein